MTKRITITETNAPSAAFAEAFALLLIEREKSRPALSLVDNSKPAPDGYKLPAHDPSRSLSEIV